MSRPVAARSISTILTVLTLIEAELQPGPGAFSAGFLLATRLRHPGGIGLDVTSRWPAGKVAVRLAGAMTAFAGLIFLKATL
jgi:hydrogenase/urease accessory protein HupE